MRCREARGRLLDRELGVLPAHRRSALDAHLECCHGCSRLAVEQTRLTAELMQLRVDPALPIDVTRRVLLEIERGGPVERDEVPARQLGWAAAVAAAFGLLLLGGLWKLWPAVADFATEARPLVSSLGRLGSSVLSSALAMLSALRTVLGNLLASLQAFAPFMSDLLPVAIAAIALGSFMMLTTITVVVGRDLRRPGWIGEER